MRNSFGFKGSAYVLKDVFKSLDADGNGTIGFDEMFEFVRGRRHSLDARNKRMRRMLLEPPPKHDSLDELVWDVETLRQLLQQMLDSYGVGVADLMAAWDASGDGQLSVREFEQEVCNLFRDEEPALWREEVQPVVHQAFGEIDQNCRHEGRRHHQRSFERGGGLTRSPM